MYLRPLCGLRPFRQRAAALSTAATTLLALAALAFVGARPAVAQSSWTVTNLGVLPNTDRSYPHNMDVTDLNNIKVVGNTVRTGTNSKYHGFYWSSATKTMVDIGVIGAGSFSEAFDVNSRGEVVGQSATTSTGGNNHALYWNPSRGAGNPLDLAPEWPLSQAYNINENGIIVGYVWSQSTGNLAACWIPTAPGVYGSATILPRPSDAGATNSGAGKGRSLTESGDIVGSVTDAGGNSHAAVWKNTGTLTVPVYNSPTLIVEPSGGTSSSASIVNGLGQVAGGWSVGGSSPGRSFGWNEGDPVATDLGTFGDNSTQAWGLNDLGQVALHAFITVGTSSEIRAAIWVPQADPAYGLTAGLNLLTTPSGASTFGGAQARPYGGNFNGKGFTLNNKGQVVGYSTTRSVAHAFIWDKVNKMRDLNNKSLTPNKATFSYLRDACGISDNGYIVGTGANPKGTYQACLLTPNP